MALDYLMFVVPKRWNGQEDFYKINGDLRKKFSQIFWQLTPDEESVLSSRVDKERFSFGGNGIDNAQIATHGLFLSVWNEAEGSHIYPRDREGTFQEMQDSLQPPDKYTEIKLRCFIRNVLDAISKFGRGVILVSW